MAPTSQAYLVPRLDDGFGEVISLMAGTRYTLGRAASNRIVLKDDLCSRDHAEIWCEDALWYVRDLGSLNGSKINTQPITGERKLAAKDELTFGRSRFLFVRNLGELPKPLVPPTPTKTAIDADGMAIKKRLRETRYLPTSTNAPTAPETSLPDRSTVMVPSLPERPTRDEAIANLYRLGLRMAAAQTSKELAAIVVDGLLESIPAEVGAVLEVGENREMELVAYRHRNSRVETYHKVSQFVSSEVMSTHDALLAVDVDENSELRNRDSLTELRVTSLLCAPVIFDNRTVGLIHIYTGMLEHPLSQEDLEFALAVAKQLGTAWGHLQRQASLTFENRALRDQLRVESELVGTSEVIRRIESQISRVAATHATVLVRGESGSGKELVARAIHTHSPRRDGPLICLNCAAVTESLLESELFGHERGAFTGATEKMIGKFEAADHGTLFLDEIGEMGLNAQSKLLRVLEGHPFERVGGNVPIKVNVRVVAATNRPLEEAIRAGTFRRDLFYRLQVVEIRVPPLRERLDDVPLLAEHFLKRFVRETGRKIRGFTPSALEKLRSHPWPGNVRELRNVIERAVALSVGSVLDVGDIWLSNLDLLDSRQEVDLDEFLPISLEEMEKRHILKVLNHTDWNKSQAAQILGIERSTLDRKIKTYNLQKDG
ncbi:sigma 54-interacting transcriptional regulator [Tuwongella immobilis]|uniref:Sigma-54 factor interaction domain-containing protein n=1 Tax=Tuwongella immobilis TaxID=692036 RepID=A0A6C2YQN1_9BACT|nr:sigma 54-interacting transcriptional regulator [Tuwongella immobilis]VIP03641.1 ornithine decarboxylase inhibitor- sigma54 transciptional regulator : Transcriptional regulator, NifA subfamily, Fis Family OS=Pirellula staleyi (strain ATCC 27377 / DSM 6068 / ICPB 4128) GN=Psta_3595 PE=4 SV=1: FHA: GAF_2: Sigma54_activat: HTH_8 [Tuwongella immobilis]VTS04650.1 ornithine decarboxylase inhibitor- sigma54 transciptional regulator : Transcriptional regulator, NifA subfamily, Fis Family OS=Pirellula s